jgi:hypothetical protein
MPKNSELRKVIDDLKSELLLKENELLIKDKELVQLREEISDKIVKIPKNKSWVKWLFG